jgi:transketolase
MKDRLSPGRKPRSCMMRPMKGRVQSHQEVAVLPRDKEEQLQKLANELRRKVIDALWRAQAGHPGGSLSAAEIMTALFFHVMKVDPADPTWEERDRFILSKGHAAPIYYVTLMQRGFFEEEILCTYDCLDSCLQAHPDIKTPGVDMPSGSLGQGLSVGVGIALGARLKGLQSRVFVLMGDGEQQEGQVWEAAMSAPYYKLHNLTAIIDYNRVQLMAPVEEIMDIEPLAEKWRAFNWNVIEIDGHDVAQIVGACDQAAATKGKPTVIIAHTVKGKGVSFMENKAAWHSGLVTDEVREKALAELGGR